MNLFILWCLFIVIEPLKLTCVALIFDQEDTFDVFLVLGPFFEYREVFCDPFRTDR